MPTKKTPSMHGFPWTKEKMSQAIERVKEDGTVTFAFGSAKLELLKEIDDIVFQARPDLVLQVWSNADNEIISDQQLGELVQLRNVRKLYMNGFRNAALPELGRMKRLTYLMLATTTSLDLSFLKELVKLHDIRLYGKFNDLDPVSNLVDLRSIGLSTKFTSFHFLEDLGKLEEAYFDPCDGTNDFRPLNKPSLRRLMICTEVFEDVSAIAKFGDLQSLKLSAPSVRELPDLRGMKRLTHLELGQMGAWANPQILKSLPNLETLELNHVNAKLKAEDFHFLIEMKSLKTVDFQFLDYKLKRARRLREWFINQGKEHLFVPFDARLL